MNDKLLHAPPDLDLFATEWPRIEDALPRRINADPESVGRGLDLNLNLGPLGNLLRT